MNEDDLLSVRNFGRKSLDELYDRLRVRGLMDKEHSDDGDDHADDEAKGA